MEVNDYVNAPTTLPLRTDHSRYSLDRDMGEPSAEPNAATLPGLELWPSNT
jgi:hypothetical protein